VTSNLNGRPTRQVRRTNTPIHSYLCQAGHETERLFLTFAAADEPEAQHKVCGAVVEHGTLMDSNGNEICSAIAERVQGVPCRAIFFGNDFYKPSPQQRGSYTVQDSTKIAAEMVASAKEQNGGRITGPKQ
jgi:hypothetical protein